LHPEVYDTGDGNFMIYVEYAARYQDLRNSRRKAQVRGFLLETAEVLSDEPSQPFELLPDQRLVKIECSHTVNMGTQKMKIKNE
jgi:hypothetical protein